MYAEIIATFRYGRDDLDVLGINFKKDLYTVRFLEIVFANLLKNAIKFVLKIVHILLQ